MEAVITTALSSPAHFRRAYTSAREHPDVTSIVVACDIPEVPPLDYLDSTDVKVVYTGGKYAGHAATANVGMAECTGDRVLLIHDDVDITGLDISVLSATLVGSNVITSPLQLLPNGSIARCFMHVIFAQEDSMTIRNAFYRWHSNSTYLSWPARRSMIASGVWLVDKEKFDDLGGFDTRFEEMPCEDLDFCLRAAERGYSCFYEPRARAVHDVGQSVVRIYDDASPYNDGMRLLKDSNMSVLGKIFRGEISCEV